MYNKLPLILILIGVNVFAQSQESSITVGSLAELHLRSVIKEFLRNNNVAPTDILSNTSSKSLKKTPKKKFKKPTFILKIKSVWGVDPLDLYAEVVYNKDNEIETTYIVQPGYSINGVTVVSISKDGVLVSYSNGRKSKLLKSGQLLRL